MEQKDHLEGKVFWLLAGAISFVFIYTLLITFLPIPKDNVRFADTAEGFFLGTVLGGSLGYYISGNPSQKKGGPSNDKPATEPIDINNQITQS